MMSGMRERPLSGKVSRAICDRFWPVSDGAAGCTRGKSHGLGLV
jgi:hypothetical protein